ncbi:MAG: PQQ-dependent sugar dehydrogenase [Gammaproteobacteria bacterium]|nr:PQQ-dependent sugar dehydrogenase [Gammaproteobacteria bacterium]MDH3362549.1 PQQ-dependent sugar dehydrogenase [Gammaproteobacteria bacterium]MDH3481354.1 PQQ-dependent sugar dehydrogenase [Gammaproteobacteria bacterium]
MRILTLVLASAITITACTSGGSDTQSTPLPNPPPPVEQFGLDSRPDNQTCVAPQRPGAVTSVTVEEAFPGVTFSGPTKLLMEPVAEPRWFVLQKSGQIRVFDPDNPVVSNYLDISGVVNAAGEGGLLGMAFHPDYPATPEIFLSYTRDSSPMRSVISRVILDAVATPGAINAGSEEFEIISVEQFASNHNGGDIAFGPDGYLYIGLGDGGGSGDPQETGQDTTNLLGAFLRLDVTDPSISYPGNSYLIPSGSEGNPFAGQSKCGPSLDNPNNCPEIYAWGVRNPWRWSFDLVTGQLWAGDVGQGAREEIDIIERGNNYGWDCREGLLAFETAGCSGTYTDPVHDYPRNEGNSITGGMVYRGSAIGGRVGEYIYADYGSGRIWALRSDGQGGYINEQLLDESGGPVAFGADANGELYFANINNGRIFKLVPGAGAGGNTIPDFLSDTGCVDPSNITLPYAGLIPYDLNAQFWSDGADKSRFLGVPNGTTISVDGQDDWQFPVGAVIVENFRLNGNLIETRHLMRHPDGVWAGYTYEWNAQQTQATRVIGGKTVPIAGQNWVFPSEAQCDQCHSSAAGHALGPETAQLNRDFTYPSTGRTDNQLETLDHVMMFASPLAGTPDTLPALADPMDATADLNDRARAYLHTNCANCHRPGGGTPVDIDLRYYTTLQNTGACDMIPQAGMLGITNARIIAPGDAARSTLVARTNRRGDFVAMPPVASTVIDSAGVTLLTDWVNGLTGCL